MEFKLDKPCLEWDGAMDRTGYGRKMHEGKWWMAHRWSYQEHYGDLSDNPADGLVIDHICFNRACVEPTHLRQISRAENSGRHNPDCPCSACVPLEHRIMVCKNGHDISNDEQRCKPQASNRQGECRRCKRERTRRYRAAKKMAQ